MAIDGGNRSAFAPGAGRSHENARAVMLLSVLMIWLTTSSGSRSIIPIPLNHPGFSCGPCTCFLPGPMVDCSSRALTHVPHSGLPTNATSISLRNNSLSALHPLSFRDFRYLQHLDLSQNNISQLTGVVFRRLTQLDLSFNHLSDLSQVRGLSADSLQWLDLSHNDIKSTDKSDEATFPLNLTHLDLSHNQLTGLSGLFLGLNQLRLLDLGHNQIPLTEAAYPQDVFKAFGSSLLELRLQGNCQADSHGETLTYPDQALALLQRLESLHIDGLPDIDFGPGFGSMTSLTNLSLSGMGGGYCSINQLQNSTFLHMPNSLFFLNVSACNITFIDADAFRPLQQLTELDLSFNIDLGFETLGNGFYSLQGSALSVLHINSIVPPYTMFATVTPWNTRYFRNTSLKVIYVQNNSLEAFCEGALRNMPDSLHFVSTDQNNLRFGSYFRDLESLKSLTIIHNDGHREALEPPSDYPPDQNMQCSARRGGGYGMNCHEPRSLLDTSETRTPPRPTESKLETTSQPGKFMFTLPPMLDTYISRSGQLYYKILEVEFNPNNSLRTLNLRSNLLTTWVGPIRGLNKLHTLDLNNNFADEVSYSFFQSLRSIKVLNASRNNLRSVIRHDTTGAIFEPLEQLEQLYLTKNYLNKIPERVFKGLVGLQKLVLSHNEIFHFNVDISHMHNLTLLDLSYNHIRFLPQSVMDHLDRVANAKDEHVTVDMTFNPIACTCEHIDFLTWIQKSEVRFPHIDSYSCLMSDGSIKKMTNIFDIIKNLQDQCTDNSGILTGAVSCFICLMCVLVSAVFFRFRWKLRYWYYASRLFYGRLENSEGDDFQYDAFVSYSSENSQFVHGPLMEELEAGAGLRLNVHNRDFTPGRLIPCNIVHAVQNSRHTLVVLTRDLLQSDWCHYELQMAVVEASHTGRDVLLFLLYEDMPSQEIPRDVLYNLQASTYITYPADGDPERMRDFWSRLAHAIRE